VDLKIKDETLAKLMTTGVHDRQNELFRAAGKLHDPAGSQRFRRTTDVGAERRRGNSVR